VTRDYQYLFGPVPSRRLGRSLGVDLMPHKTCSLDCVYCECGKTTHLTLTQKEYVPVDRLQEELHSFLKNEPELDVVTFSGAGEPTLHSGLADIIQFINGRFPKYKTALLTNGTLFYQQSVRAQVTGIDLVIASVDAASEAIFRQINRPHPQLNLSAVLDGLFALRKEFSGRLWVEVFLVPGLNDGADEVRRIQEVVDRLRPDRVQLNTLDRPGTEKWVEPLDREGMARIAACIHKTELIAPLSAAPCSGGALEDIPGRLLAAIRRRPCTLADISKMLDISEAQAHRYLAPLLSKKVVSQKEMPRGTFYIA